MLSGMTAGGGPFGSPDVRQSRCIAPAGAPPVRSTKFRLPCHSAAKHPLFASRERGDAIPSRTPPGLRRGEPRAATTSHPGRPAPGRAPGPGRIAQVPPGGRPSAGPADGATAATRTGRRGVRPGTSPAGTLRRDTDRGGCQTDGRRRVTRTVRPRRPTPLAPPCAGRARNRRPTGQGPHRPAPTRTDPSRPQGSVRLDTAGLDSARTDRTRHSTRHPPTRPPGGRTGHRGAARRSCSRPPRSGMCRAHPVTCAAARRGHRKMPDAQAGTCLVRHPRVQDGKWAAARARRSGRPRNSLPWAGRRRPPPAPRDRGGRRRRQADRHPAVAVRVPPRPAWTVPRHAGRWGPHRFTRQRPPTGPRPASPTRGPHGPHRGPVSPTVPLAVTRTGRDLPRPCGRSPPRRSRSRRPSSARSRSRRSRSPRPRRGRAAP